LGFEHCSHIYHDVQAAEKAAFDPSLNSIAIVYQIHEATIAVIMKKTPSVPQKSEFFHDPHICNIFTNLFT